MLKIQFIIFISADIKSFYCFYFARPHILHGKLLPSQPGPHRCRTLPCALVLGAVCCPSTDSPAVWGSTSACLPPSCPHSSFPVSLQPSTPHPPSSSLLHAVPALLHPLGGAADRPCPQGLLPHFKSPPCGQLHTCSATASRHHALHPAHNVALLTLRAPAEAVGLWLPQLFL